jgi:SAM-dependent methyltransferase
MAFDQYDPIFYDLVTPRSVDGDMEWYRGLSQQQGSPILELGAGTGRIVIPLAEQGFEVHAIEQDPRMYTALEDHISRLEEAVRRRIKPITADMRSFELEDRFRLIQIPYRAFLHNLAREDQLACLLCCRRHLQAEGILSFNVFHPSLEFMSRNHGAHRGVWRINSESDHPEGGVVVYSEANLYDTASQRVSSRHRYEHFNESGRLVDVFYQRLELAYLYPGDLRDLLHRAGFSDVEIYGGFDRRPFSTDGEELVVVARP